MGSFRKDLAIIGRAAAGTHDYCGPTLYGHRALRCGIECMANSRCCKYPGGGNAKGGAKTEA